MRKLKALEITQKATTNEKNKIGKSAKTKEE
jgi:hypothetical protein